MGSGRHPNWPLRQQIAELRFRGLTLQQIGDQLGVTRQAVHAALRPPPGGKPFVVRCRLCSTEINVNGALPRDAATALCLPCLARRPQAPFSQRLRAFRLAAGLTRNELARASGVAAGSISDYEEGRREPKWRQMAKLIRALGAGLVTLGLDDRGTGMTA